MVAIVEQSWQDVIDGKPFPESLTRKLFREAVEEVSQKAREALTESHGRIDAAVKIVLAGDVELLDEGQAKVASQSNGTTKYFLVNGECECKDFPKAPANFCKHRLAYGIAKRANTLAKQRLEAQLDNQRPASTPEVVSAPTSEAVPEVVPVPEPSTPVSLPEAPASANVYIELAGRKVQITLRDSDEAQLLFRMEQLLARFPVEESEPSTPSTPSTPPEGWCAVHQTQMKRYSNDTGSWWSHRLDNNEWCRGK